MTLFGDLWYFLTRFVARLALILGIGFGMYQGFLWLEGTETLIGIDSLLRVLLASSEPFVQWLDQPYSGRPFHALLISTPAFVFLLGLSWLLDR